MFRRNNEACPPRILERHVIRHYESMPSVVLDAAPPEVDAIHLKIDSRADSIRSGTISCAVQLSATFETSAGVRN